ncbi:hypothetical protein PMIN06_002290 [Paraphaeosphaeria minitans]|uniref:Uncharacterized protein n=1 Tax=Paraphaeosphaeria minitans TaxID=565426 RepID=A0A9P6GNZ9_9PLEO|nr:hypothetical protein PMIN01_01810 [Paraphaeosphaeria minitans]
MTPLKTDLLITLIEGRPITPEIARDVLSACITSERAMKTISHDIAAYLELKWYSLSGTALRKRIADANHELFRSLALLDYKVQNLYAEKEKEKSYAETGVASVSSSEAGTSKGKGSPAKAPRNHEPAPMAWQRNLPTPHWAVEIQKSATKTRHFATLLRNPSSCDLSPEIEKVYDEMLEVYELQRLNLVAVVGIMRDRLASFHGGDKKVWEEMTVEGPHVGRWLPDCL